MLICLCGRLLARHGLRSLLLDRATGCGLTLRLLSSSAILDLSSLRLWTLQSVGAVDRRTATMRNPAKFDGAKANPSRRLICTRGPGLSLLYVFGASQVCILDLEPRAFLGEGPGAVPGCLPQLEKHRKCSAQKVQCP